MTSLPESKTLELQREYPQQEGQPLILWGEGVKAGWLEFHQEPAESTGEFRGQRLVFRYSARLHPRVTVYRGDSQEVLAEYVPCFTGGGIVSFDSGVRYRWKKADMWSGKWCFRHAERKSCVCLSQDAGPLVQGGRVRKFSGFLVPMFTASLRPAAYRPITHTGFAPGAATSSSPKQFSARSSVASLPKP